MRSKMSIKQKHIHDSLYELMVPDDVIRDAICNFMRECRYYL